MNASDEKEDQEQLKLKEKILQIPELAVEVFTGNFLRSYWLPESFATVIYLNNIK